MARRNKRKEEQPRELTRKEIRTNARQRERDRKFWMATGVALGIAVLIMLFGVVNEFVIKPNSTLAQVGNTSIVTRDFWKHARLEHNRLQNQLIQLRQFEQQFGAQTFLSAQINEVQATLSSPFALGLQTLDRMIEQIIIRQEAAARGITVSEEAVEAELRREVAGSRGEVTIPQATATAEAGIQATATAASWTPTPTPTIDAAAAITATATPFPTPEPPPTSPVLTEEGYLEGLAELEANLNAVAGMSLDEYRQLIRDRLLAEQLEESIAAEAVVTTEEQVNARHILLNIQEPLPELEDDSELAPDMPEPRDEEETLALAEEIHARLLEGEDFAELAAEYSDDTGSAIEGGELGWFGRGAMIPEFEEAAFALEEDEISEPVLTSFGYHIIQVLERDENRPKDESTLQQERQLAFDDWLRSQVVAANVQRPTDLVSRMPRDLRNISPAALSAMPLQ